ncbi:MAG: helix-turn-helix domain-containing protein [Rothia sp. (in: high G+C Gram-positive bacteria)]|nr:helix-turn-helix domain-containing protein [Rothia sp. (in: high G+C Gram-positive bacteria)]
MPKVSEEYKTQVRQRIIDAARECFVEKGYERTSMGDIIGRAQLSAGAIYNHFSGKQEIIVATAQLDLSLFEIDSMADSESNTTLFEVAPAPWDFVLNWLEVLHRQPQMCKFMMTTWGEAATVPSLQSIVDEQLQSIKLSATQRYEIWAQENLDFTEAERQEWIEVMGTAILAVFCGYVVQSQTLSGFSHQSYVEYAAAILEQA